MFRRSLGFVVVVVVACSGHDAGPKDAPASNGDTGDLMPDADPACLTPGMLPAMHAELVVGTGLTQPIFVTQPPGSTDLYVVEKPGRIRIVRGGAVVGTFLDVTADVNIPMANAEGGLLSVAFKPDYVTSGRFFVYMTIVGDHAVVREYHRMGTDTADPTPVAELISIPNGGYNDVGGTIAFGPDHYLWVGAGDAANPPESADTTSRRGKMLRVDVDNPGTPPPGNLGGAADPFVWDYGLRNPFRFSFDHKTGELYLGDAGDTRLEEVDIEPPNQGHRDYGWPRMEGDVCADGSASCGAIGTPPAFTRPHQIDYSVLIGGVVYRGAALPCLRGQYLFGVFGTTGHILSWHWTGSAVTMETDLTDTFNIDASQIVDFGEDLAGEVYLVTLSGAVYKIVPT